MTALVLLLAPPFPRSDSGPAFYCLGDLNHDRSVNFIDLAYVRSSAELTLVRAHFFEACPAPESSATPALAARHRYALVRSIRGSGPGVVSVYVTSDGRLIGPTGEMARESLDGYVVFSSQDAADYTHDPWEGE